MWKLVQTDVQFHNYSKMEILFTVNESAYGSEKAYNGLRTALQLLKEDKTVHVNVFLMGDGVSCSLSGQAPSASNYNVGNLLSDIISKNGKVKICKSCLEGRGYGNAKLVDGAQISSMTEYAQWIIKSEKAFNV